MKEILFRGKRKQDGMWFEGYLVQYANANCVESYILTQEEINHTLDLGGRIECDMEEVLSETVGQFTGLTDKNGKKIFTNDTVRCYGGEYCQGFWEYDSKIKVENDYNIVEISESEHVEII